ncbi:MAG: hypothetical protein H7A46_16945 [Verrucomicrobiales bacterium]|nr:hypothetical protein [Verrucomicrobiales bacterium]
MSPEHKNFLSLAFTPARLDAEQAAWFLGFHPHDIPVLVAVGLLRPLGKPRPNATKYFAAVELESLRTDPKWLGKATDAIQARWREKNLNRTGGRYGSSRSGPTRNRNPRPSIPAVAGNNPNSN